MRLFLVPAAFLLTLYAGQPPQQSGPESFVDRMMAFDKNHDGKLTRDEITDERLLRIFDRADVNKDGIVTKEELEALYIKEGAGGQNRPPGGPGGPGGRGGGRGGFGPPPQPGQVIPRFMQDRLNLTADQKKQIDALQKEVDAKLDSILSADQKQQLKQGPGR
jgi:hypothetical protein